MSKKAQLRFHKLLKQLSPAMQTAFYSSIAELTRGINYQRAVDALRQGNIEGVLDALGIDEAAFLAIYESAKAGFAIGARTAALAAPRGLTIRFDGRDMQAEALLEQHASKLVRDLTESQREVIREVLRDSLSKGENPRSTITRLVGRVSRATKRREGGILGLTGQHVSWLDNAREELENLNPAFLKRVRRDRRNDARIKKAIKKGIPLSKAEIDNIVGLYANKLLALRAENFALNESFAAINQSMLETYQQAVKQGKVAYQYVEKIWHSTGDTKVRETHRGMNGQRRKLNEKFNSSSGAVLDCPHDFKASASETNGCRCWMEVRVNYLGMMRAERVL